MRRGLLHAFCVVSATLLLLLSGLAHAAVTGKVAGRVTDAQSGEPLVGVAVVIVGTTTGATSDDDGRFFIINVPPGLYNVQANLIGYQSITKNGIRVSVDRTVNSDFALEPSAIEVGGVTVTAPREVIKLDVSGSSATVEAAELDLVPRKSLQEALALQPGIDALGGVRGGTLDQTQMIVDGRLAVDERLNRPVMTVSTSALEEVQVLTGGFNAEYGNARSGVFNVVTRNAAGQPLWASANAQYFPAHKKFFESGGDAFGANSFEWKTYGNDNTATMAIGTKLDPLDASKTIPDTLFKSWNVIAADAAQNPKGLSAAQLRDKWRHQHPAYAYGNKPDYVADGAIGVPIIPQLGLVLSGRREYTSYATPQYRPAYEENLFSAKLNTRPMDKLRLDITATGGTILGLGTTTIGGGLTNTIYRDFGASINFLTPETKYAEYNNPAAGANRWGLSANATYTFTDRSFMEAGVDYNAFTYEIGPSDRKVGKLATDPGVLVLTGTKGTDIVNSLPYGWLGESAPDGTRMGYELGGGNGGMDSSDYNSFRVFAAFTSQIDARNLIKTGFEGVFINLNQYGGSISPKETVIQKWSASPSRFGAFAQDRIEYEGMIANLGLRMDYFNSNGEVLEPNQPYSHIFDENKWGDRVTQFDVAEAIKLRYGPNGTIAKDSLQVESASSKVELSPRLGISHPIGQATKVFFNYGHFYTVPSNQYLFGNNYNQPGSIEASGNANLNMPRTISYELGSEFEIARQYLLRTSVFYKDATDEIAVLGYTAPGVAQKYTRKIPYNKAYSDIRGFEFSFAKRVGAFVTGFVNGGVQTTTTTRLGNLEVFDPKAYPTTKPIVEALPIAYRAQPYGKLSVSLHTPVEMSAFGMPALATGGWELNWLTEYQRGGSTIYDPVGSNYVKSPNVYFQDSWLSDMRITKGFAFGSTNVGVYMDVLNVFGRKIWNGGMRADDYQAYLRSLHFPVNDPVIEDTPGNDKIGDTPSYAKLPERDRWALWKYPRTFAFGLRVNF